MPHVCTPILHTPDTRGSKCYRGLLLSCATPGGVCGAAPVSFPSLSCCPGVCCLPTATDRPRKSIADGAFQLYNSEYGAGGKMMLCSHHRHFFRYPSLSLSSVSLSLATLTWSVKMLMKAVNRNTDSTALSVRSTRLSDWSGLSWWLYVALGCNH